MWYGDVETKKQESNYMTGDEIRDEIRDGTKEKYDVTAGKLYYFGYIKDGLRFPSSVWEDVTYKEEPDIHVKGKKKHGAERFVRLSVQYKYKSYRFYHAKVGKPRFLGVK